MAEEYAGVIREIIYHNNENGYTVAVFDTESKGWEEEFTIVGARESNPAKGQISNESALGKALLGEENALLRREISMGGEDFSYFVEKVPGAFWHLGCAATLPAAPLHSRDVQIDERCLPIGAAMQCALALDRMGALG